MPLFQPNLIPAPCPKVIGYNITVAIPDDDRQILEQAGVTFIEADGTIAVFPAWSQYPWLRTAAGYGPYIRTPSGLWVQFVEDPGMSTALIIDRQMTDEIAKVSLIGEWGDCRRN